MSNVDGVDAVSRLDRNFIEFHRAHPEVYTLLVCLARRAVSAGHDHVGMAMLYEVVRWEHMVGPGHRTYRLNNNHKSRYVRLIASLEPDLARAFEMRAMRS